MFHDISANMQQVMRALEEQTARDQPSLRSVTANVGRCLSLLAMSAPQGAFLELGSSGGYSSLWLSLAARAKGVTLTTVDLDERKVALARKTSPAPARKVRSRSFMATRSTTPTSLSRSRFAFPILSRRSATARSTN